MARDDGEERARSEASRGGAKVKATLRPRPRLTGGRPPRKEVSALQLRGIAALLSKPNVAAAAADIGVHPRTISRWFKENAFSQEYLGQLIQLQHELWRQMLAVKDEAWTRFLELMRGADDRLSLRATTWYLERMLSAPAVIANNGLTQPETEDEVGPRVRALLNQAEAIEREEHDSP